MAEDVKDEQKQEKPKSSSKMLLIIVAVLIILILAIGAMIVVMLGGQSEPNVQTNQAPVATKTAQKRSSNLLTIGPMYALDQFVVNLLSENGSKYLKASLDIELNAEELSAEIDKKKPAIRDIIIRTLSSKTFEEVSTMKGKDRLKDEIVEKLNEILADGQVRNIFFTDFVVQ